MTDLNLYSLSFPIARTDLGNPAAMRASIIAGIDQAIADGKVRPDQREETIAMWCEDIDCYGPAPDPEREKAINAAIKGFADAHLQYYRNLFAKALGLDGPGSGDKPRPPSLGGKP